MVFAVQDVAPSSDPLVDGSIDAFMVVVTVVMALGVLLFVWLLVRNVRMARRTGRGRGTSLSQRLQELDDLHRRGLISDAEHAMARQRALTSP